MRSIGDRKKDGKLRELVSELIGEEAENDHTHKPDTSHNILNDLVLDRGPNPSKLNQRRSKVILTSV